MYFFHSSNKLATCSCTVTWYRGGGLDSISIVIKYPLFFIKLVFVQQVYCFQVRLKKTLFLWLKLRLSENSTPKTRYSKLARQTRFVYYIKSFTISRQSISIKSHEGSWVLFTISRILLYRGLLYRVSGVLHMYLNYEFYLVLIMRYVDLWGPWWEWGQDGGLILVI